MHVKNINNDNILCINIFVLLFTLRANDGLQQLGMKKDVHCLPQPYWTSGRSGLGSQARRCFGATLKTPAKSGT